MTDRDDGRYDDLLLQTVQQIQTDVSDGRRESAEFRVETTAKLTALEVKVETLGNHMSEDARKNRKLAVRSGAISGGITGALATVLAFLGLKP